MLERRAVAHIRADTKGLASSSLDLSRGFVDLFLATCGSDDVSSGIREAEAQSASDPGCSSDYNCGLAFEAKDIGSHNFIATVYGRSPVVLCAEFHLL